MQIEEAIEKLKETAKQCRNSKECWENEDCCDCYVEVEDIFAIETVLNELEEQTNSNKELNKVLIHFKAVINEMAEQLVKLREESEEDCFIPRIYRDIDECVKTTCKDCIKQYFSEKIKEK